MKRVIILTKEEENEEKKFDNFHPTKQIEEAIKFSKTEKEYVIYTTSAFVLEAFDIRNEEDKDIKFIMKNKDITENLCDAYRDLAGTAYTLLDMEKEKIMFKDE